MLGSIFLRIPELQCTILLSLCPISVWSIPEADTCICFVLSPWGPELISYWWSILGCVLLLVDYANRRTHVTVIMKHLPVSSEEINQPSTPQPLHPV